MDDWPSPDLELNNGVRMPALGLGVFLSPPEQTAAAVETAIEHGYRLINTAAAYNNERQVGEGIRRAEIDRADVFVTSKLWMSDFGYESAVRACEASLRRLGMDYLDLYLLHWPFPASFADGVAAYRAGEKLMAEGRVRAIGVSNFKPRHLDDLMGQTDATPAVNQVELSPYFSQPDLRRYHAARGIVTQCWSPIGGERYRRLPADTSPGKGLLEDPVLAAIAAQHGRTPAQIVLRWHLQHGLSPIPKSVTPQRIAENIGVFDFVLTADEMAAVDDLDTGVRAGPDPDDVDLEFFEVELDD